MTTLKNRVAALENIDTEVINAVGSSLREIVQKNDDENQAVINNMALDLIKNVLQAFPEHAQKHVLSLFQKRLNKAHSVGYSEGISSISSYRRDEKEPLPKINDLLGVWIEERNEDDNE